MTKVKETDKTAVATAKKEENRSMVIIGHTTTSNQWRQGFSREQRVNMQKVYANMNKLYMLGPIREGRMKGSVFFFFKFLFVLKNKILYT